MYVQNATLIVKHVMVYRKLIVCHAMIIII